MVRKTIDKIDKSFNLLQHKNIQIIENANENIDMAIMGLDLPEKSEKRLEDIMTECLKCSNENFYEGVKFETVFEELRNNIDACIVTELPSKKETSVPVTCSEPKLF